MMRAGVYLAVVPSSDTVISGEDEAVGDEPGHDDRSEEKHRDEEEIIGEGELAHPGSLLVTRQRLPNLGSSRHGPRRRMP